MELQGATKTVRNIFSVWHCKWQQEMHLCEVTLSRNLLKGNHLQEKRIRSLTLKKISTVRADDKNMTINSEK